MQRPYTTPLSSNTVYCQYARRRHSSDNTTKTEVRKKYCIEKAWVNKHRLQS